MIIRKQFKFEASHVVRDCTHSRRCSFNIHGHSFIVEAMIEGSVATLDRAHMVRDFGGMQALKEVVDRFDHAHIIGHLDPQHYIDFVKQHNERWIQLPCNPSAEMLSIVFFELFTSLIPAPARVHSVRVHETATGYAECTFHDVETARRLMLDGDMFENHIVYSNPGPDYNE